MHAGLIEGENDLNRLDKDVKHLFDQGTNAKEYIMDENGPLWTRRWGQVNKCCNNTDCDSFRRKVRITTKDGFSNTMEELQARLIVAHCPQYDNSLFPQDKGNRGIIYPRTLTKEGSLLYDNIHSLPGEFFNGISGKCVDDSENALIWGIDTASSRGFDLNDDFPTMCRNDIQARQFSSLMKSRRPQGLVVDHTGSTSTAGIACDLPREKWPAHYEPNICPDLDDEDLDVIIKHIENYNADGFELGGATPDDVISPIETVDSFELEGATPDVVISPIETEDLCDKPIQIPVNHERSFCVNNKWKDDKTYAEFITEHTDSVLSKCSNDQLKNRYNVACGRYV